MFGTKEEKQQEIKQQDVDLNVTEDWIEVKSSGQYWEPEMKGDSLEGTIMEARTGLYGSQWVIKTSRGDMMITPSHKVLQARMAQVKIGEIVKIVFEDSLPPQVRGQNPTKMYKVYHKPQKM